MMTFHSYTEVKEPGAEYTFEGDRVDGADPQKVRTKSVKKIKIRQTGIDGAAWGVRPSIYARGLAKYANGASEFQFTL